MKEPKCILITGASSGIGKSLALEYAAPGTKLLLLGRNQVRLTKVKEECEKLGAHATISLINVRDAETLADWIKKQDKEQNIDLVIANAGISGGTGKFKDLDSGESEQQVREIFSTNVNGVLNTILPVIPRMRKRHEGQIAIMSSMASFIALPGAPSYSASKAAVRFFGEAIRTDLSSSNVRVSVICPGYIETPLTDVNDFSMPFIMKPGKAARIIKKGLDKDKGRIVFPLSVYSIVWLSSILPKCLTDPILSRLPKKS